MYLAQGPMLLMADGYKKCGEVFTVPLLHKNVTFLIGPATAPHFFKANDDEMSQTEVTSLAIKNTASDGIVEGTSCVTELDPRSVSPFTQQPAET